MLPVQGPASATPTRVRIEYDGQRFKPATPTLAPGPAIVEVSNTGPSRGSLMLTNWPPEVVAMPAKPTLEFDPYLSGGMLLTRQTFRKLFRAEQHRAEG